MKTLVFTLAFSLLPALVQAQIVKCVGASSFGQDPQLRVTGVRSSFDGAATLRLALRLHPRTRQVYIVADGTPHDSVGAALESMLRAPGSDPPLHQLPSQPLPQLSDMLSQLAENSLVIDLSMFGRRGETTIPPEAMAQWMARASRAPVWAACDPLVGYGLVGAVTTPMEAIGQATAEMVVEVLQRPETEPLPPERILAAAPIFDWRQLRRWGIRARQLPAGNTLNSIAAALAGYPADACRVEDLSSDETFCLAEPSGIGAPFFRSDLGLRFSAPVGHLPAGRVALFLQEGIVFRVARILEDMQREFGIERVYLSGGLSSLPCLRQGIAACVPVETYSLLQTDASLTGAARLAAGMYSPDLRKVERIEVAADRQRLLEKYRRWKGWLVGLLQH